MGNYLELYRIKLIHDYFDTEPCRSISCRLSAQCAELARRRRLLFRQVASDEWVVLYDHTPQEGDVLTFSLHTDDPLFPLYTKWVGYMPAASYEVELPGKNATMEAEDCFRLASEKKSAEGLCSMTLCVDSKVIKAAEAGNAVKVRIHFQAPSVKWKYIFVPREGSRLYGGKLRLEDSEGNISFTEFEDNGGKTDGEYRTCSRKEIPMRVRYDCKLKLVAYDDDNRKIVLLSKVMLPELGRFMDTPSGTICQICYY